MTNVAIYVTTDSILAQNIIRRRISRPTEEEEELSRGVSQTSKEIQYDVEYHSLHKLDRYVSDDTRYSLGCRVVERVRVVFFDNRALRIKPADFSNGRKGVEEDSQKQYSTSALKRRGAFRMTIIDGTDNECHDKIEHGLCSG